MKFDKTLYYVWKCPRGQHSSMDVGRSTGILFVLCRAEIHGGNVTSYIIVPPRLYSYNAPGLYLATFARSPSTYLNVALNTLNDKREWDFSLLNRSVPYEITT